MVSHFHGQHDHVTTLRLCLYPGRLLPRGAEAIVARAYRLVGKELPMSKSIEAGVDGIFAIVAVEKGVDLDELHEAAERVSTSLAKLQASVAKTYEPLP